jgi:hypothetical protein
MEYSSKGLMPNLFPEGTQQPLYNTVDAALLFILAVYEYEKKTGDSSFVKRAYPIMKEIVHWYENNGIGETAKKRNNYKYRQWRSEVIARDGFRCTECGGTEDLVAHHIKPFASYPLERFEVSNGITLCARCHRKTHKEARMNG